jgi:hypothetical protein
MGPGRESLYVKRGTGGGGSGLGVWISRKEVVWGAKQYKKII